MKKNDSERKEEEKIRKRFYEFQRQMLTAEEHWESLQSLRHSISACTECERPICLIPFFWAVHFQLFVISPKSDVVTVYDNRAGHAEIDTSAHLISLLWALELLTGRVFHGRFAISNCQKKDTNTECGPFVCLFAALLLHGNPALINETQVHDATRFRSLIKRVVCWTSMGLSF